MDENEFVVALQEYYDKLLEQKYFIEKPCFIPSLHYASFVNWANGYEGTEWSQAIMNFLQNECMELSKNEFSENKNVNDDVFSYDDCFIGNERIGDEYNID